MSNKNSQPEAAGSLFFCLLHLLLLSNCVILFQSSSLSRLILIISFITKSALPMLVLGIATVAKCNRSLRWYVFLLRVLPAIQHARKGVTLASWWLYSRILNWSSNWRVLQTAIIMLSMELFHSRTGVIYLLSKYVIKRPAYCSDYNWLGHAVTGSL